MFGQNTAMGSSTEAGNRCTWTVWLCSETDDLFQIQFPSAHFVFTLHQSETLSLDGDEIIQFFERRQINTEITS